MISYYLILLIVVFLPLIVKVQAVLSPIQLNIISYPLEMFTYWKSVFLFLLCPYIFFSWLCENQKKKPKIHVCVALAYLFFVLTATLKSEYPDLAWFGLYNYREGAFAILCYVVLFLGACHFFDTEKKVKQLVTAFEVSFLTVGLVAFLQLLHVDVFALRGIQRIIRYGYDVKVTMHDRPVFSTLMNANHLGLYCALLFPFLTIESKYRKIITPLMICLAIVSESRACWLSMVVTSSIFIFINRKKMVSVNTMCGIFIVLFSVFCFFNSIILKQSKMTMHFSDQTFNNRVYMWRRTLPLLSFFGKGPASLVVDFPNWDSSGNSSVGWAWNNIVDRPHNIYLQVWENTGFFSLVCFLFLPTYLVIKSNNLSYSLAVIGYFVCAIFTDSTICVAPLYWIILGCGYRCYENTKQNQLN